jgi:hypothetical protein
MKTNETNTEREPVTCRYALRREGDCWRVRFGGGEGVFPHERGALYVAYLLAVPPRTPVHAVALAFHGKDVLGACVGPNDLLDPRGTGLEVPGTIRALWERQRELERLLQGGRGPEPYRAEAQQELEQITDYLRKTPWMSRLAAGRCARAVGAAVARLCSHLARAADAEGKADEVLRAFGAHLEAHLLATSRRAASSPRVNAWTSPGWLVYVPPRGVEWSVECRVSSGEWRGGGGTVRGSGFDVEGSKFPQPRPAAVEHLSRFLCIGYVLALALTGCAGPRPLKGGKAIFTHKPAGVEQTLVQSENPAQATKQDEQSMKVRTYTVPAGSRIELSSTGEGERPREPKLLRGTGQIRAREDARPPGPQPSTAFTLSAAMPVVEREESRARTELGAAQKDTAREVAAKLASLKGIVWVGIGLFIFGLASLVWPPLKVVIGSVTTSAALMLGGVALMVLPGLVVGNELLILGVVALGAGGWFLAHRHGELKGRLKAEVRSLSSQLRITFHASRFTFHAHEYES